MILDYWKILFIRLFGYLFKKDFPPGLSRLSPDIFLMLLLIFCSIFCLNWNNLILIKWRKKWRKDLKGKLEGYLWLKGRICLFHVNNRSFPISNYSAFSIWQYPHDFLQSLLISFLWTSHKPPFCHCSQYTPSRSIVFSQESVKKHESFNEKPIIKD